MGKIIGIGGIFMKSPDVKKLAKWYKETLNINMEDWGTTFPISQIKDKEMQVFSVFPADTKYINTSQSYMINWMVDDLDALILDLKAKKIEIIGNEASDYGKFAWINDCDGNKLELWQAPKTVISDK